MFRPRHLHRCVGLIALCAAALASTTALAQSGVDAGKPVFLVTDVVVGDGLPIEKDTARDVLATRFGRIKDKLDVRSMAEARASVDAAALAQLMGGGSDEDMARIENYMQVDRLVLGRVSSIGGVVDLQVKVFNVREGVTEVGFARRLGKNADRTMVLTMLDTLADSLLAWTIQTYTDGAPSTAAQGLKNKKLARKPEPEALASSSSPWSGTGVLGGVVAGAGAGLLGVGLYEAFADNDVSNLDIGLLAAGGAALLVGGSAVTVDLVNGVE
jgi:hypothetical protein